MKQHIPRKRFGQNFLIDHALIAALLAEINPHQEQLILEIGPGQGALTKGLIASKAKIDAVEIDRDLAKFLSERYASHNNFTLHCKDILQFSIEEFYNRSGAKKLRVVGNLPYNISTPLLFKLFANANLIKDMYFMLQREVALRLIAQPGTKDYGRLSIMAQYFCEMEIIFDVPPESFDPPPKVESNIVHLIPRTKPIAIVKDIELLQNIVSTAFNQRRKTISNSLKNLIESSELKTLNIDPQARAENLSLEDYVHLTNYLQDKNV